MQIYFFFVSTIFLCILGIFSIVIFIYITKIIIDIRGISRIARNESADISEDIKMIRKEVNNELNKGSSIILSLIRIIKGLFRRRKARINRK